MRIGILGGGQLAQMMAQSGAGLGMEFMFLCPDALACAAPYGQHICAPFQDEKASWQLARWAEVVTYEFENVPLDLVSSLEKQVELHPSSGALSVARDRLLEKSRFRELDIPTAEFMPVEGLEELRQAVEIVGLPAILKTRTQGYDGKGQAVIRKIEDIAAAWAQVGGVPCIVESVVRFSRELSIIAVRGRSGEVAFYPLSENYHREGILRLSLSCLNDPLQFQAQRLIQRLLEDMQYVGVLALELFQVGEKLYANEMAPRVHNSGHWTIEGAATSQFENHLRAICGMPLGETGASAAAAMVNLVGRLPDEAAIREIPNATPHFYGKGERPGRKVGHITLIDGGEGARVFAHRVAHLLKLAGEDEGLAQVLNDKQSAQTS
ncbi:MAG: 5-(carboxyamino)imidazole ribonucleotide synthase [Sedimenticola sp.]|nr:MAG: 5-(carboxyamino)imidazole ribonucleotide synthase [Sedimenticola sp.]